LVGYSKILRIRASIDRLFSYDRIAIVVGYSRLGFDTEEGMFNEKADTPILPLCQTEEGDGRSEMRKVVGGDLSKNNETDSEPSFGKTTSGLSLWRGLH